MRHIPTILRIIANIFIFLFYALLAIIIENFIFGLIMVNVGKTVPGSEDPIHMALAIGTIGITALATFIFRKYFYLSICNVKNINPQNKIIIKEVIKEKKEKETKQEENIFDDNMKIYIDKEIK